MNPGRVTEGMRQKWKEKARFLVNHQDMLSPWELGLLGSVTARLEYGSDITIQQSISLTETFDKVQRKIG